MGLDAEENFANDMDPYVMEILREIGMDPQNMKPRDKKFASNFVKRQTMLLGVKPRPKGAPPPPPPPMTMTSLPVVEEKPVSDPRGDLLADIRSQGSNHPGLKHVVKIIMSTNGETKY